ncbi:hypothetical protein [Actinomyces provencensis]|uniref:hypothetical protein n=1 Tax=Actinomyces provencensis TaxID=1720198 RepID=UPI00096A317E|nr:hypothetical protein [Actinomyces provencensis]
MRTSPAGGGWALYEREIQYQSGVTAGGFFFQIEQATSGGDTMWQVAGPLMWKRVADMAVKARDDVTLAALTDVANVRRYYLLQSSTLNPPAAPTSNPAPSPWVTAEPTYTEGSTTSLYTVDLTVFTDGTFDYSAVSKSSSYEAAKSAFNKAVAATNVANAALAAVPPFVQQATPSATVVGQLWFPLDASGRMIGMKRASKTGTSGWVDYLWMAGRILVPGSVGTTEIGPDGVLAANIKASNELWAKLASFAKVTTGMLIAGNATITEDLLANVITGIIIRGGLFEAGGGSLPMVRIGPLSGQVGVGDTYGVQITTPNNSENGSAVLGVDPTGPYMEFYDGTGKQVLATDKTGVRVVNQISGGMVDISLLAANTMSWSITDTFDMKFWEAGAGTTPWWGPYFFRTADGAYVSKDIGAVGSFTTPTGKVMIQGGVDIGSAPTYQIGASVQWGIYTSDPTSYGRGDTMKTIVGGRGRAECARHIGGVGQLMNGSEVVTGLTPGQKYWIAPFYWCYSMGALISKPIKSLWVSVSPIT